MFNSSVYYMHIGSDNYNDSVYMKRVHATWISKAKPLS